MKVSDKKIFILCQFAFFAMLIITAFFPLLFIFTCAPIIIITVFLFSGSHRLNAYILLPVLLVLCIISGGDIIVVLFTVLTVTGVTAAVLGFKQDSIYAGGLIALILAVIMSVFTVAVFCLKSHKNTVELASDYVAEKSAGSGKIFLNTSGQIAAISKIYYRFYSAKDYEKLSKSDENYKKETLKIFEEYAKEWGEDYLFYDIISLFALTILISFLAAFYSSHKKTFDSGKREKFIIKANYIRFINLRFNRKCLLYVFIPIMLFSFLGFIKRLSMPVSCVVNAALTIPSAVTGITVLAHSFYRIKRKGLRITLNIVLILLAAVSLIFSIGLIIFSVLGLADAFLDVRKLLDYATGESIDDKK